MPCGDGTGPLWAYGRDWRCWGSQGHGRRIRLRYWQRYPFEEPWFLTKEEQKKILETELQNIETEKKGIEKRLKEIESGGKCHDQDVVEE